MASSAKALITYVRWKLDEVTLHWTTFSGLPNLQHKLTTVVWTAPLDRLYSSPAVAEIRPSLFPSNFTLDWVLKDFNEIFYILCSFYFFFLILPGKMFLKRHITNYYSFPDISLLRNWSSNDLVVYQARHAGEKTSCSSVDF